MAPGGCLSQQPFLGQSPFGDSPARRLDGDVCLLTLLELYGGASFLELALDRVGLFLGDAFLDRVGRAVDEVLCFLQAEARDRADDLDHLDLLSTGLVEDDVERRLLLRSCGAVAGSSRGARGRNRDRSGSGHAPFLLELVLELDEIEDGHAPELLDELVCIGLRHYCSSSDSAGTRSASADGFSLD